MLIHLPVERPLSLGRGVLGEPSLPQAKRAQDVTRSAVEWPSHQSLTAFTMGNPRWKILKSASLAYLVLAFPPPELSYKAALGMPF